MSRRLLLALRQPLDHVAHFLLGRDVGPVRRTQLVDALPLLRHDLVQALPNLLHEGAKVVLAGLLFAALA